MARLRIIPVYGGNGTVVNQYRVVDENDVIQFQGTYTECYYVCFPNAEDDYLDKEAFDEAHNNPR